MADNKLTDGMGRPIHYMRVSVTDRCNLRCRYCTPSAEFASLLHGQVIRYEEIERLVRLLSPRGITSVRITGGEPLVRKHIGRLITSLDSIEGIKDISLTTNGLLLAEAVSDLYDAGLKRVNVSLDTLDPQRFSWITNAPEDQADGGLSAVLEGLREAKRVGLGPIKINVVLMRGFNDDELEEFTRLAEDNDYEVRFIEFMPVGPNGYWGEDKVVTATEAMARIETVHGKLESLGRGKGSGPARRYRIPGHRGTIGFITPISSHFCVQCNRIRLTADGMLRTCLFSEVETNLLPYLRGGASDEEILAVIDEAIIEKPQGHEISEKEIAKTCARTMSHIGG